VRIVSNASPLIFLAKIDALGLLQQCFSHVLAPPAVFAETGLDFPDFIEQSQLSEVGEAFVRGALGTLHQG
jgi:predicted nucleic acid-binding protein